MMYLLLLIISMISFFVFGVRIFAILFEGAVNLTILLIKFIFTLAKGILQLSVNLFAFIFEGVLRLSELRHTTIFSKSENTHSNNIMKSINKNSAILKRFFCSEPPTLNVGYLSPQNNSLQNGSTRNNPVVDDSAEYANRVYNDYVKSLNRTPIKDPPKQTYVMTDSIRKNINSRKNDLEQLQQKYYLADINLFADYIDNMHDNGELIKIQQKIIDSHYHNLYR